MDVVLKFPNADYIITGISAFTRAWGINSGLDARAATELALATTEIVTDIIRFAYGGPDEEFEISFRSTPMHVEIIIHEFGVPFDPERHVYDVQKVRESNNFEGAGFRIIRHFTDDFLYLNKGKQGKEFRLVKKIADAHIAQLMSYSELIPAKEEVEEPKTHYHVLPLRVEDSEAVSKLIYKTYKHTYYKDVLYYPKKVGLAIEQEKKFGVLTRTDLGEAVGYFAVIKLEDTNLGEVGEAVVLPQHRRKGLMKRMLHELIALSRERKILGLFGEANAAHTFSQRANARFNFKSTAIILAVMPPMPMIGFDPELFNQHVSAVFEFVPLFPMPPRTIYPPEEYRELISDIYAQFDVDIRFGITQPDDHFPPASMVDVRLEYEDLFSLIIVQQFGEDFLAFISQTIRDLQTQNIVTIHIDLPIEDPGTAIWALRLRELGFLFAGLMPFYHHEKDYLRMQRTTAKLEFDKIVVYSDIAKRIKIQILSERA